MSDDKNYIDFDDKKNNVNLEEDIEIVEDVEVPPEEVLEISEEDYDIEDDNFDGEADEFDNYIDKPPTKEEKFDLLYHFNTNKHRQEGKHRLKRDTIFKGKLDKKPDEDGYGIEQDDYGDISTFFDYESEQYSNNLEQNNLTKDVYEVLREKTELDFKQNRRKPNKETFNNYYNLLLKELGFRYTKSEIFVELSYYFTDNIFNMFKLLDKRPATIIIKELKQKGYLKDLDGINFF
jgi:hypothetical protein